MSLKFNWRFFDIDDLKQRVRHSLTESMAQTKRPPSMVSPLEVIDVDFGTTAPDLAFQNIEHVDSNRAHVLFALKYAGDASLTLSTAIEANQLREPLLDPDLPDFVKPRVVGALSSLILPFKVQLQNIHLDSLIDVVYTPNGVAVNWRGDPLKSIDTKSSLDMIPGVKEMIGSIIQLRMSSSFLEDVPESIWTLSSPNRQPPDPWFGASRWSQQHVRHVRYGSLIQFFGPSWPVIPIQQLETMALGASIPGAILSRQQVWRRRRSEPQSSRPEKVASLFDEASESSSAVLAAQPASSRPRRRVISLKKATQALQDDDNKTSSRAKDDISNDPHAELGNFLNHSPVLNKQAETCLRSSRPSSRTPSRSASRSSSRRPLSSEPRTPPAYSQDEIALETVDSPMPPPLPRTSAGSMDTMRDNTLLGNLRPKRRDSIPVVCSDSGGRRIADSVKLRTSSLQPTRSRPSIVKP